MTMTEPQQYRAVDKFDRMLGALSGLPDVTFTKPSTVQTLSPLIGEAQVFIVVTYRQREIGDTIFLTYVDGDRSVRLAIPPAAADAIARQREALTAKNRRKGAAQAVETRKRKGIVPQFVKDRKTQAK
jgi:hypothetical protein